MTYFPEFFISLFLGVIGVAINYTMTTKENKYDSIRDAFIWCGFCISITISGIFLVSIGWDSVTCIIIISIGSLGFLMILVASCVNSDLAEYKPIRGKVSEV